MAMDSNKYRHKTDKGKNTECRLTKGQSFKSMRQQKECRTFTNTVKETWSLLLLFYFYLDLSFY